MPAYYNEIDKHAAAWLRELIRRNLIAPGDVDERSIVDVQPEDLREYTQCHFFAGIGGWSYALRLAGWPDDRPVWTGSCPCQPFSVAGQQRGSDDERHLWPAFFRLIRERRPAIVFGEQVAGSSGLAWLDHVAADLEDAGYAAAAANLGAHSVGAFHLRQRLYWMAQSSSTERGARRAVRDGKGCGWPCVELAGSGDVVRMAHSDGAGSLLGQRDREPDEPGQQASQRDDAYRCGADGGMADQSSGGLGINRSASRQSGHAALGNATIIVADRSSTGRKGSDRSGDVELHRGQESLRPVAASSASGIWADVEWIWCRDGKARPAQRGIFPLVDGLPDGLVRGGDSSTPLDADATPEARVMRLRGYGNSVVPQVAAAFVEAYMGV